ncbi:MAG: hypothetical protein KQJ78_09605 [Deltaproteobacteria bacterium]|nr:hypothetical protein [Deltaproteobacteria bacterium]
MLNFLSHLPSWAVGTLSLVAGLLLAGVIGLGAAWLFRKVNSHRPLE